MIGKTIFKRNVIGYLLLDQRLQLLIFGYREFFLLLFRITILRFQIIIQSKTLSLHQKSEVGKISFCKKGLDCILLESSLPEKELKPTRNCSQEILSPFLWKGSRSAPNIQNISGENVPLVFYPLQVLLQKM